jgi:Protein of unknown function (DUF4012)
MTRLHPSSAPTTLPPPSSPASAGIAGAVVVVAALGGALLWLTMLAAPWRLASGLLAGSKHIQKAERSLSAGAMKAARYETLSAGAAVQRARSGLDSGGPVFAAAELIAPVARVLHETDHLIRAAEFSAAATRGTLNIAENALTGPDKIVVRNPERPQDPAEIQLDRIEEIGHTIEAVRHAVAGTQKELQAIDPHNLPRRVRPDIRAGIRRATKVDALLAKAQKGFALLPAILGGEGTRTYLLAMQNSAELRGTGGAMLRFADVQFSDGRAQLLKTQSVYSIDKDRRELTIPLPDDAWYVAGIADARRFGNANWSPDWPLTSKLTLAYRAEADRESLPGEKLPQIDGVIGVDPITMKELLKGAGRFETSGGRPITSRKVLTTLLYKAYAQFPNPGERRSFLNEVVDLFYARVLKPKHPSDLVRAMGKTLVQKHTQIWMADPLQQEFIKKMNWDGGIQRAKRSNYLYVVEQNVGGNKLNFFEDQIHTMDVSISGSDAVVSTEVRIHNGAILPAPRYVEGDSEGFHRPMINVYVPEEAELTNAEVVEGTRLDTAAEGTSAWPAENRPAEHLEVGKRVWSTTLEVPPGQDGAVRFDYRVPSVVRDRGDRRLYRLVVQRQPKLRPETLRLSLQLPEGASRVKARGWKRSGDVLTLERVVTKDQILDVSWRE